MTRSNKKESPLLWPRFTDESIREVAKILRSGRVNYWTGDKGRAFEKAFAAYLGVKKALCVSSGTAALHLALEALGVGKGDDVVVTPYSFRASATCVNNAGARPVFADVGDDHMLNAETIARALTPRTKAVIVVHLYGQVADMAPILKLAKEKKFFVIEDCAQCLGGEYRGKKVGTLGDAGCFSFCQSKHITTGGEGGMVVCRSQQTLRNVESLRDHGWTVGSSPKEFSRVGWNARMTEMQSAVGLCELKRFESWNLPRRKRLADEFLVSLKKLSLSLGEKSPFLLWPVDTEDRKASFWLVPIVFDERRLKCSVASFAEKLQKLGAPAYRVLWPLMAQKKNASKLLRSTIGFWVHPTMRVKDMKAAVMMIGDLIKKGGK